jgi:uncharacterized membrane protein YfcA
VGGEAGLVLRDGAALLPARGRVDVWLELDRPVMVRRPLSDPVAVCRIAPASDEHEALQPSWADRFRPPGARLRCRCAAGPRSSPAGVIELGGTSVDTLSATFAAAVGVALLAGLVRGFSGFGSAMVLSPSLSALYGPEVAVPVALLLELALAVPFVPPALRLVDRRRIGVLCLAAALTVPIGAWLLVVVDAQALRWAICALVFAGVAVLAFGWRHPGRPHTATTAATGALSGLLGGSTGLSGPPVIFYELSVAQPIARIRANFMTYFAWVDVVALTAFAVSGTLAGTPLLLALALVVPYLAAAGVGARLFRHAGEGFYRRLALVVLVGVALVSLPL